MELWIWATLAATVFQTIRFALQKHLSTTTLTTAGATFARFAYSAPRLAVALALWLAATHTGLPQVTGRFWAMGAIGGAAQILATLCVVALFKTRNFAVGITFKKTEVVQAALVGWIVLGEGVSPLGLAAIFIGLIGVLALSKPPQQGASAGRSFGAGLLSRASALGLASGLLFAVSGVTYRAATLDVASDAPLLRAAVTLSAVTLMQFAAMSLWLRLFERGQISAVWAARRKALWIGLMSLGGSYGWFIAFTLQTAAYVKALGQIELILSLLVSVFVFRERTGLREAAGMALIVASVLLLVLAT